MADPKRELIAAALEARLGTIGGSGYNYTFTPSDVRPWMLDEPDITGLPCISFKDRDEPATADSSGGVTGDGVMRAAMNVDILAIIQVTGEDITEKTQATAARRLLADMMKALGTDESFGGLADWTLIKSTTVDIERGEYFTAWAFLKVEISYQYDRWDYTQ